MKEMKRIALAVVVIFTLAGSQVFGADAVVWGYFTDSHDNDIDGEVSAVSSLFQDDDFAFGSYMMYLPPGNYTITGNSDGYKAHSVQLTVEDDETYRIDFALELE